MIIFSSKAKVLDRVMGSLEEFSLFVRIYHIIMLITLFVLLFSVPFNYLIGFKILSFTCFILLVVFSYFYYISRFKGKVIRSIVTCCVLANIFAVTVYIFNGGIDGPVFLISALCIILTVCCSPKEYYLYWILANVSIVFVLMGLEFVMPDIVQNDYEDKVTHFIDLGSSYLLLVLPVCTGIAFIRNQYQLEKNSAESKTLAIEKQHQTILFQNKELERLNTEKNKLVSIIAHDLRAPLSNIQNYLELLSELDLDETDKQNIEEDLLRHTKNASELLTKLLAWSKTQMNGINARLKPVYLKDCLKKILDTEKHIAANKKIDLDYNLGNDICLNADGDMLELVVRNLVSNAIKFTRNGGAIDVSTSLHGKECWIKIADNGLGISEKQQSDIFTFIAGSTFGTDKEKGTGLGLLLCKDFIEIQGGRIWFESQLGTGSTFYIALPVVDHA